MSFLLLLCFLGSFAEEDLGRQGLSVPSVMGNATASRGLEVAVANLQDYCNGMGSAYCSFWLLILLPQEVHVWCIKQYNDLVGSEK